MNDKQTSPYLSVAEAGTYPPQKAHTRQHEVDGHGPEFSQTWRQSFLPY